jgi:tetratricopeptide (TPR) repeat protein
MSRASTICWPLPCSLGDYHEALVCCQQAFAMAKELGNLNDQAHTCDSIAYIHHQLGHHRRAILHCHEALELFRMTGDRHGEASCLAYLGDVHRARFSCPAAQPR